MAFQTGMATRWSIAALAMTLNAGAVLAEETGEGWLDGPWRFGAIAYGWLPEAPATVKVDQEEVANMPEDLDSIIDGLEMAAMLEFNAHKGRLGLFLSPVYYDGKEDTNFQGVLGEERKLTVEEEVWLIDYGVGWDLGTWKLGQGADAPELTLSPFAGFRYFHDPIQMQVAPGILDMGFYQKTTVEINTPLMGLKAAVKFSDRWSLGVEGDYGVFDDSEVNETYQYMGVVNYHFTMKNVSSHVLFGYRFLHLDLENNEIAVDVDVKGPLIGIGVNF